MAFQYPLLQPRLIVVERQIPVLRLLHHGLGAADGGVRVDEFHGAEVAAALLALVAIGVEVVAVWAFAHDIAVGQKLAGLFVIILLGLLLHELAVVVELAEEVAGQPMVRGAGGAAVDVERNAELLERLLDHRVVAVHHVLRGDALLAGADGDGHAVLVASADEDDVLALQPQVADVDVGGYIHAGQVADVHATVGVWQRGGDGSAFIVFLFHVALYLYLAAKIL